MRTERGESGERGATCSLFFSPSSDEPQCIRRTRASGHGDLGVLWNIGPRKDDTLWLATPYDFCQLSPEEGACCAGHCLPRPPAHHRCTPSGSSSCSPPCFSTLLVRRCLVLEPGQRIEAHRGVRFRLPGRLQLLRGLLDEEVEDEMAQCMPRSLRCFLGLCHWRPVYAPIHRPSTGDHNKHIRAAYQGCPHSLRLALPSCTNIRSTLAALDAPNQCCYRHSPVLYMKKRPSNLQPSTARMEERRRSRGEPDSAGRRPLVWGQGSLSILHSNHDLSLYAAQQ